MTYNKTDLSIIRLNVARTLSTILTRIPIAYNRHITTFTVKFCFSILLITLTDCVVSTPACTIQAKKFWFVNITYQKLASFTSSIWRTITSWCTDAINHLNHTCRTVFTIFCNSRFHTTTDFDLALVTCERITAIATEFISTSIVKASTSIL